MNRFLASAFLVAGLMVVGCDSKDDSTKDVNKAADKTANQATDALEKAKDNTDAGADKAKDMMKDAEKNATKAAEGNMDMMQKQIDDLIAKAKDAVKDKKWSDAEGYLAQIKPMIAKLPADYQAKVNANLADVQKMIDAGKNLMPGR